MRRRLVLLALVLLTLGLTIAPTAMAQDDLRVLVYTRTTAFRHLSIPDGIAAIQGLGVEHGFGVDHSEDPGDFTDGNLARYDVVIFLNTTGDPVDDSGQAAFERFIRGGGGWMGIHSAADTEYDWPFYGRLLGGAWFLAHPPQQQGVLVNEAPEHPATAHLAENWALVDEWYSFHRSPRDRVEVLLSINESTYLQDPNTTCLASFQTTPPESTCVSGVMGDHPMAWCTSIDEGRGFYTAIGHESYLYQLPDYLAHLWGGIQTAGRRVDANCGAAPAAAVDPVVQPQPDPGDVTDDELDDASSLPATGAVGGLPVAVLLLATAFIRRR